MKSVRVYFSIVLCIFCWAGLLLAQTATAPALGDGTSGNPYQIATLENLYWIAAQTNSGTVGTAVFAGKYFKQTADIDASATSAWFSGAGWTPIGYLSGSDYVDFAGVYDGQNHTISNVYINRPSTDEIGLFGGLAGGSISNLGIVNITVTGKMYVGAIGYVYGGCTITNCYSSGSVTANSSNAGGLVGNDDGLTAGDDTYSQCHSSCSVSGTTSVGGLIGYSSGSDARTIASCYATGSVTATGADAMAGGFVGYSDKGTISNSYASGSVTSLNGYAGGFVSTNYSTIISCFATGTVTGKTYLGGFASTSGGTISNCYSSGNVAAVTSGGDVLGGFSGVNTGTMSYCYASGSIVCNVAITTLGGFTGRNDGTINANCFWSTRSYSLGCGMNNTTFSAVGKTDAELRTQSTYTGAGWTFPSTWTIDAAKNNQYPSLAWQTIFLPTVTTSSISTYNAYSATMGGTVTSDGGATVTARGVVYATGNPNPSIGQSGTLQDANGSGTGAFSESIGSLIVNKNHYVRAYATNSVGTSYGTMQWFVTPTATLAFTNGSGFTQSITSNTADQVLGRFQLSADGSGASLTGATIQLNGTRTGVSNFKLWSSADATFESGADTQLGAAIPSDPGDGNALTFSGFTNDVSTSGTYYFVTADVAASPTGTVQCVIVQNSSLTVSNGAISGTNSNAVLSNGTSALPVELLSFTTSVTPGKATLLWQTASEVNNYGFDIERRTAGSWTKIGFAEGHGTTNAPTSYSFVDPTASGTVSYRLKQIDRDGKFDYSRVVEATVAAAPIAFALSQNYPNPFNPSTTISFSLPSDSYVTLAIVDVMGREVETIVSETMEAGIHRRQWNAAGRPSGVYFYRMQAGPFMETKPLMLLK